MQESGNGIRNRPFSSCCTCRCGTLETVRSEIHCTILSPAREPDSRAALARKADSSTCAFLAAARKTNFSFRDLLVIKNGVENYYSKTYRTDLRVVCVWRESGNVIGIV